MALARPSLDFSQYLVGTITLLIQLTSAPLSMSATKSAEKSSTIRVTIENHFWNVILDIDCINCFVGTFVSNICEISIGIVGGISICWGGFCIKANFASRVKSFVFKFITSFFKNLTSVFNWLISCCNSFVVILVHYINLNLWIWQFQIIAQRIAY